MRCQKIEKWLSDRIDGELSKEKERLLEDHLERCASCRSYAASIAKLQDEAMSIKDAEISPVFWEEFASKLKANLESFQQERKERKFFALGWSWVWSGAALLAVVVGLYLLFFQSPQPQEMYVFSLENSLARIYQEIGDDSELEELFNSVIVAAIGESLEDSEWRESPDFLENLLLWEDLSEEEIKFLESEIKKDV
ncbi:MAG: zf-HC2 domain-containing protein [Candidatus Aminicenantes bacterium]|nr:MAG: zf-HC2 domain-containing protein [Candidatus Aminicenantes bacterium]